MISAKQIFLRLESACGNVSSSQLSESVNYHVECLFSEHQLSSVPSEQFLPAILGTSQSCVSKTEEAFKRQRDASEHGGGSTSLERASDLRTFYFTERLYSWRIVQELLRIDRDPTHPDFNFASEFISNYMTPDKNLLSMVLKKLASAFKGWEPEYLSESQISDFSKIAVDTKSDGSSEAVKGKNKADGDKSSTVGCSAQECVNFSQAHLIAWCAQVSRECECVVETLLLLLYQRTSLSVSQLTSFVHDAYGVNDDSAEGVTDTDEVVCGKRLFPAAMANMTHQSHQSPAVYRSFIHTIQRIQWKLFLAISESFHFWRGLGGSNANVENEEQGIAQHPLLTVVNSEHMRALHFAVCGKLNQKTVRIRQDRLAVIYIWRIFVAFAYDLCPSSESLNSANVSSDTNLELFRNWVDETYAKSIADLLPLMPSQDCILSYIVGQSRLFLDCSNGSSSSLRYIPSVSAYSMDVADVDRWMPPTRGGTPSQADAALSRVLSLVHGANHPTVPTPQTPESSAVRADKTLYITILHELLQVIVAQNYFPLQKTAFINEGSDAPHELEIVCDFVEVLYCQRESVAFCNEFWTVWTEEWTAVSANGDNNIPPYDVTFTHSLCRLLALLLRKTSYKPNYVFRILSCLCSSEYVLTAGEENMEWVCDMMIQILSSNVPVVSWESLTSLVEIVGAEHDDLNIPEAGAHMLKVCYSVTKKSPPYLTSSHPQSQFTSRIGVLPLGITLLHSRGTLLEILTCQEVSNNLTLGADDVQFDRSDVAGLVQWADSSVSWWVVMLDRMVDVIQRCSRNTEHVADISLLEDCSSLLQCLSSVIFSNSLFSNTDGNNVGGLVCISDCWENLILFALLVDFNQVDLFAILRQHSVTVKKMKYGVSHPSNAVIVASLKSLLTQESIEVLFTAASDLKTYQSIESLFSKLITAAFSLALSHPTDVSTLICDKKEHLLQHVLSLYSLLLHSPISWANDVLVGVSKEIVQTGKPTSLLPDLLYEYLIPNVGAQCCHPTIAVVSCQLITSLLSKWKREIERGASTQILAVFNNWNSQQQHSLSRADFSREISALFMKDEGLLQSDLEELILSHGYSDISGSHRIHFSSFLQLFAPSSYAEKSESKNSCFEKKLIKKFHEKFLYSSYSRDSNDLYDIEHYDTFYASGANFCISIITSLWETLLVPVNENATLILALMEMLHFFVSSASRECDRIGKESLHLTDSAANIGKAILEQFGKNIAFQRFLLTVSCSWHKDNKLFVEEVTDVPTVHFFTLLGVDILTCLCDMMKHSCDCVNAISVLGGKVIRAPANREKMVVFSEDGESYLAALIQLLPCCIATSGSESKGPEQNQTSLLSMQICRLLITVVCLVKNYSNDTTRSAVSSHSLIDSIGSASTFYGFCFEILQSKEASLVEVKCMVVDLLTSLVIHQPASADILFRSRSLDVSGSNLTLVVFVESLLSNNSYKKCPKLLSKAYKLILTLWEHIGSFSSFATEVLSVFSISNIWTMMLEPLLLDIPTPEIYCSSTRISSCLADVCEEHQQHSCNYFCEQLSVQSAIFKILSKERFGSVFLLPDENVGVKARKAVDLFLVRANEAHRFFSWVRNCMRISWDEKLYSCAVKSCFDIGIGIEQQRCSEVNLVGEILLQTATGALLLNTSIDKHSCASWLAATHDMLSLHNMYSLCMAQSNLLVSWRIFLQVFVVEVSNFSEFPALHHRAGDALRPAIKTMSDGLFDEPAGVRGGASTSAAGTLSPSLVSVGGASPQSPSTSRKSSYFTGDKRSYEILSEISKHLSKDSEVCGVESILGLKFIDEKCLLLQNMLYHQLREVSHRSMDPSCSRVVAREIDFTRLSINRIGKLLDALHSVFDNVKTSSMAHATGSNENASLPIRVLVNLLTSMLLLMQAVGVYEQQNSLPLPIKRSAADSAATTPSKPTTGGSMSSAAPASECCWVDRKSAVLQHALWLIDYFGSHPPVCDDSIVEGNELDTDNSNKTLTQCGIDVALQLIRTIVCFTTAEDTIPPPVLSPVKLPNSLIYRDVVLVFLKLFHSSSHSKRLQQLCKAQHSFTVASSYPGKATSAWSLPNKAFSSWDGDTFPSFSSKELRSAAGKQQKEQIVNDYVESTTISGVYTQPSEASPLRASKESMLQHEDPVVQELSFSSLCSLSSVIAVSATTMLTGDQSIVLRFMNELNVSPLFQTLQECLCNDVVARRMRAVLGYNSMNGEESVCMSCWRLALDFMTSILSCSSTLIDQDESRNEDTQTSASFKNQIHEQVLVFIRTYTPLIRLILDFGSKNVGSATVDHLSFSLVSLRYVRSLLALFSTLDVTVPAWKLVLASLHTHIQGQIRAFVRLSVPVLRLSTDKDLDFFYQCCVYECCIMVKSAEDKRHDGLTNRSSVVTSTQDNGAFEGGSLLGRKLSGDAFRSDSGGSVFRANSITGSSSPSTQDIILSHISPHVATIRKSVVAVLMPIFNMIRQQLPLECFSEEDLGHLQMRQQTSLLHNQESVKEYPQGSKIFFISKALGGFLSQGVVVKSTAVAPERELPNAAVVGGHTYVYAIRHFADGSIEGEVPSKAIVFEQLPMFPVIPAAASTIPVSHYTFITSNDLTVILRFLMTSPGVDELTPKKRPKLFLEKTNKSNMVNYEQEVTACAELLAFIIVMNCRHIAKGPSYGDDAAKHVQLVLDVLHGNSVEEEGHVDDSRYFGGKHPFPLNTSLLKSNRSISIADTSGASDGGEEAKNRCCHGVDALKFFDFEPLSDTEAADAQGKSPDLGKRSDERAMQPLASWVQEESWIAYTAWLSVSLTDAKALMEHNHNVRFVDLMVTDVMVAPTVDLLELTNASSPSKQPADNSYYKQLESNSPHQLSMASASLSQLREVRGSHSATKRRIWKTDEDEEVSGLDHGTHGTAGGGGMYGMHKVTKLSNMSGVKYREDSNHTRENTPISFRKWL